MQQAGGRAYLLVRENPAQARVGLRVLDRHPASETGRPRPRALLAPRLAGDGAGGQATPTLRCGRAAVERRLGPVWVLRANVWANAHVPNTLLVLGLGSGHSHHNHRGHALDHHHRRCETEGWCASRRRARRTSRTAAEWLGSASQSRNTSDILVHATAAAPVILPSNRARGQINSVSDTHNSLPGAIQGKWVCSPV
jgi:hypothetical protein